MHLVSLKADITARNDTGQQATPSMSVPLQQKNLHAQWEHQLFSFQSLAVHWMARTSSLNCLPVERRKGPLPPKGPGRARNTMRTLFTTCNEFIITEWFSVVTPPVQMPLWEKHSASDSKSWPTIALKMHTKMCTSWSASGGGTEGFVILLHLAVLQTRKILFSYRGSFFGTGLFFYRWGLFVSKKGPVKHVQNLRWGSHFSKGGCMIGPMLGEYHFRRV